MNALPLILLAIALILFTIAWLVHPATSGGVCNFQPNVDRRTCPEEACEHGVPGCTRSNFQWIPNECVGTGAGCNLYSDKSSCSEQYGCAWENKASTTIAILTTLSAVAAVLILGMLAYALHRWLAQRRRTRAAKTSPTTTAIQDVDEETGTKKDHAVVPDGGDRVCDETVQVEVNVSGNTSIRPADLSMEEKC